MPSPSIEIISLIQKILTNLRMRECLHSKNIHWLCFSLQQEDLIAIQQLFSILPLYTIVLCIINFILFLGGFKVFFIQELLEKSKDRKKSLKSMDSTKAFKFNLRGKLWKVFEWI